ncbi:MAG: flagellar basal-body rod protein FlgG [Vampirovibrionales bacterium]|nr:flagellar basal-body rod protein FlgG [Vampirovibrionales bacterium]
MMRSLYTSATGAQSQQFNIDVIANNVANVNTTGYKKVRAEFQDLLSQTFQSPGALTPQGTYDPVGVQVGLGVGVSATQRVFLPGSVAQTGNPLDLAIQGDGFFQVQLPSGEVGYSRDGTFKRDANGQLVTSDGYMLQPSITIPPDASEVVIALDGNVFVRQSGSQTLNQVGQIQLAKFSNPAGLESIGRNIFRETPGSGNALQGTAGQGQFGNTSINQGFLENSNVQIVEELINLITAQRAFEANSQVMRASDEVLKNVNNIV